MVDIQAGFGLATLIDPASHTQTPLIGSLLAYAAGALFFGMNGHFELLRILAASLEAVPLGGWALPLSLDRLLSYLSAIFVLGMGVAGAAIMVLLLIDIVIALLARTVPQMNVLIMGFQVKTIALLLILPICFGVAKLWHAAMPSTARNGKERKPIVCAKTPPITGAWRCIGATWRMISRKKRGGQPRGKPKNALLPMQRTVTP